MKLFKMLGNIFAEDSVKENIKVTSNKSNLDFDTLVANYNAKHNGLVNEESVVSSKKMDNVTTYNNRPDKNISDKYSNKTNNSVDKKNSNNNINNCYVLFAPTAQSLLVLNNKEKIELKLFNINHSDKNHSLAKQASAYLNETVKKKTVYFEKVSSSVEEYKIYLDKEKTVCLNDMLIQNDLHESGKPKDQYLIEQNNVKEQYIKPVEKKKSSKAITGIFIKGQQAPYLFDTTNSLSYVVTLKNDGEEKQHWGVDLNRTIKENEIKPGDYISIENIGPQMVTVEVPIKDKDKKIIRYETKTVKRNTWVAILLEEKKEVIENKTNLQTDIKNDNLSNGYALFPVNANSFLCMHNNNKKTYEFKNVDISNMSDESLSQIKLFLQEKLSKKVVYLQIDIDNPNLVTVFLDKNGSVNLNELINEQFIRNKSTEKAIKNDKPVKKNITKSIENPLDDNLDDDFFSGFDIDDNQTANHDDWGNNDNVSPVINNKMAAIVEKNKLNPTDKPKKLSFGKPK